MIDLRTLRPARRRRDPRHRSRKTHRAVVVDEGWRSGSLSAEVSARITERAFYDLDAPVGRVCSAEVPMPYAKHLEQAALPTAERDRGGGPRGGAAPVGEFRMPSLGADMEHGTVVEWLVKPGDDVHRGDIVAVVDTDKAVIDVEVFEDGVVDELLVEPRRRGAGRHAAGPDHRDPGRRCGRPPVRPEPAPAAGRRRAEPVRRSRRRRRSPSRRRRRRRRRPTAGHPTAPTPPVRHLAHRLGVDLAAVHGTGKGGAITRADVERAAAAAGQQPPTPRPGPVLAPRPGGSPPSSASTSPRCRGTGPGRRRHRGRRARPRPRAGRTRRPRRAGAREPHRRPRRGSPGEPSAGRRRRRTPRERVASLRRAIGALMARSKQEIPHYYLSTTIDLRRRHGLDAARQRRAGRSPTRLVPAALLLKAAALAATRRPRDERLLDRRRRSGRARPCTSASRWPCARAAWWRRPSTTPTRCPSTSSWSSCATSSPAPAAGRLQRAEMADPTITVTNLGDLGVESVFGVIYPPQVALVGFGRVVEQPWARERPARRPPGRHRHALRRPPGQRRAARRPLPRPHRRTAAETGGTVNEQDARHRRCARPSARWRRTWTPEDLDDGARLRQDLELDSLDFLRLLEVLAQSTGVEHPRGRLRRPDERSAPRRLHR